MEKDRNYYGMLSGIIGVLCNSLLAVVKIITGMALSSMAVLGDGFNNLSDAVSSVITLVGAKVSGKEADEEHPFGHARMEYVASAVVAVLIIQVGLTLLRDSVQRIFKPEALSVYPMALAMLFLSVLVKGGLFIFNRRLGKKSGSKLLLATAKDSFFDIITTSPTIATTLIYAYTKVNLDAYAGVIVSVVIIIAGADILKEMLTPLIGARMDPELVSGINDIIKNEEGVLGSHDLVIHNYGPEENMATVHLELDKELRLIDAHKIADRVEKDVFEQLSVPLVTHIDPSDINDQRTKRVRERVVKIIEALDTKLSIHDFQLVKEGGRYKASFDLMVPASYSKEVTRERKKQVDELLTAMNSRYAFEITLDHGIKEER